jgi:hypothetical protein
MSGVISPVTGTRIEPTDSYQFVKGTTATFKTIFTSDGIPTTVDTLTSPTALIFKPLFMSQTGSSIPEIIATLTGTLVPGQQFEYQFVWDIPNTVIPSDEYIISYKGSLSSIIQDFGDEYFTISYTPGMIGMRKPSYATINDIRQKKFNIDDYLPKTMAKDLNARNSLIQSHLNDAATRLREELNLTGQRGNTENYRLFCVYYTIWSILLASRGEDGSSVSDNNILFWRTEWERILSQSKRKTVLQGIPFGRG